METVDTRGVARGMQQQRIPKSRRRTYVFEATRPRTDTLGRGRLVPTSGTHNDEDGPLAGQRKHGTRLFKRVPPYAP